MFISFRDFQFDLSQSDYALGHQPIRKPACVKSSSILCSPITFCHSSPPFLKKWWLILVTHSDDSPDFWWIFWFVVQFKNCAIFVGIQLEFCMFSRNWLFEFFYLYWHEKTVWLTVWVIFMSHKFWKPALSSLNLTTMTSLPTAIGALAGRLIWYVLFNLTQGSMDRRGTDR